MHYSALIKLQVLSLQAVKGCSALHLLMPTLYLVSVKKILPVEEYIAAYAAYRGRYLDCSPSYRGFAARLELILVEGAKGMRLRHEIYHFPSDHSHCGYSPHLRCRLPPNLYV